MIGAVHWMPAWIHSILFSDAQNYKYIIYSGNISEQFPILSQNYNPFFYTCLFVIPALTFVGDLNFATKWILTYEESILTIKYSVETIGNILYILIGQ